MLWRLWRLPRFQELAQTGYVRGRKPMIFFYQDEAGTLSTDSAVGLQHAHDIHFLVYHCFSWGNAGIDRYEGKRRGESASSISHVGITYANGQGKERWLETMED